MSTLHTYRAKIKGYYYIDASTKQSAKDMIDFDCNCCGGNGIYPRMDIEIESVEDIESLNLCINIPHEFVHHYNGDKFEDSLKRIRADIHSNIINHDICVAGNYEIELIDMLIDAFMNSKETED